jgi:quercetin dioxygenase-like cupin family protein
MSFHQVQEAGTRQAQRLQDLRGFARGPDEGEDIWLLGGLFTFKALSRETGGNYSLCEIQAPEGFAIPRHYHDEETEGFYVVDGEVALLLGAETILLGPGSFGFAPPNLEHAFRIEGAGSRLVILITPGAPHEAMFREMGEPAAAHVVPPPPSSPPDPEALARIAAKHGTRITGPLFER